MAGIDEVRLDDPSSPSNTIADNDYGQAPSVALFPKSEQHSTYDCSVQAQTVVNSKLRFFSRRLHRKASTPARLTNVKSTYRNHPFLKRICPTQNPEPALPPQVGLQRHYSTVLFLLFDAFPRNNRRWDAAFVASSTAAVYCGQ